MYLTAIAAALAKNSVRTLSQHEELPLLRDHLLRLDRISRHDRFHGFMDDSFIERYAEKCANDGTVIVAYFDDGVVRGAAELHPPEQSPDSLPEIAFSVEASVRRRGVGTMLFEKLIAEARAKDYQSLRITTGAQNEAMRTLANKFGAHLTFQPRRIHRGNRSEPGESAEIAGGERHADGGHAGDRELQSRLLADAAANVRLGPGGLIGRRFSEAIMLNEKIRAG